MRNDQPSPPSIRSLLRTFAYQCVLWTGVCTIVFAWAYLGQDSFAEWTPHLFWFCLGVYFLIGTQLVHAVTRNEEEFRKELASAASANTPWKENLVGLPIAFFTMFVLVSFVGWRNYGDSLFVAGSENPLRWVAYGIDNVIRACLFDFAEIFRFDLSKIEHASGFLPPMFVLLTRAAFAGYFLRIVWRTCGVVWREGDDRADLYTASSVLDANVVDVWNQVTDTSRWHELSIAGVRTGIDRDTASVGTPLQARSLFGGNSFPQYVTEWQPCSRFATGSVPHRSHHAFDIEELPEGVRVSFSTYYLKPWWKRLLSIPQGPEDFGQKRVDMVLDKLRLRLAEPVISS